MHQVNWVVMPVRGGNGMVREAIESVLAQTIHTEIICIDNGSADGTQAMLHAVDERVRVVSYYPQHGVAHAWNVGLRFVWEQGAEHALVVNSDVILRPDTYERLLNDGGPFVTGVGVRGVHYGERRDGVKVFRDGTGKEVFPAGVGAGKRPHPDFSCFLIRRAVWDAVGEFDEAFRGAFAEDADMHVRMHKAGIEAYCIDLPFLHHGSATIQGLPDKQARLTADQAGRNRAYFREKWGCAVGSTEYYHGIFGHDAPGDAPPMT